MSFRAFILLLVLFEIVCVLLYLNVEHERFHRSSDALNSSERPGVPRGSSKLVPRPPPPLPPHGLPTDPIFDHCTLTSNPTWTEEVRRLLHPNYTTVEGCDRSYSPWSSLGKDGRVSIRRPFRGEASCKARSLAFKDERRNEEGAWHDVDEQFVFESDIVEVECAQDAKMVYRFLHSQIWSDRNEKKVMKRHSKTRKDPPPSVYIMLMDSFGASQARRTFPKTLQYLKETFEAVEFNQMNKAGENSRPNAFAFLFGKSTFPIYKEFYGLPSVKADLSYDEYCNTFLDEDAFLIKQFEKKGYKTLMAEDWAKGVFIWPHCKGFQQQPTTHYMRPFQVRYEQNAEQLHQGPKNCFELHHFQNEYTQQFMNAYPDSPKMALNWDASLGHDNASDAFHADVEYLDFFRRNQAEIDNSFLFFMADHGLRYGPLSETRVGQRDSNNPMLFISVPNRFRKDKTLIDNLNKNANELLTMFDLHATFVDILESFTDSARPDFSNTLQKPELRGTSILRPLPPGARNCKTLPIPPPYCICDIRRTQIEISEEYASIARVVAEAINHKLNATGVGEDCERLRPDKVTELLYLEGTEGLYRTDVLLQPSEGIYQTYVRRAADGSFRIAAPDFTRMDDYGNEANCITNNEIRPLCYCKGFDKNHIVPFIRT